MRGVVLDLEAMDDLDLTAIEEQLEELVIYPLSHPGQVAERIRGFDLVITNKVKLDAELLSGATDLKLICVIATGTDVIDKIAASKAGITVCNAVAYGVDSVAQHVLSLLLALHNNLLAYSRAVEEGRWQRSEQFCFLDFPIRELRGKALGIIGYGNLGHEVARLAEAFGMTVLVAEHPDSDSCRSGRLPFYEVLQQSDVVSLHCPLTPQTHNLINAQTIAQMKPGSFLINTARGPLVDETALAEALESGQLAGAATDVLSTEPPGADNPLLNKSVPNLIVTPHVAWGSVEARRRIVQQTAENIAAYLQGQPCRVVN